MKIIALSDIHGNLIHIDDECDVVIIAGDWSPLYCQHDYIRVLDWMNRRFIPWMKSLKSNSVIFIPGNHDLACEYSSFNSDFLTMLNRNKATDKVYYLNRSSVSINGKKFYGIPDSESPKGWAFSKPFNVDYSFDEDTDVLITHQPPRVGDVGYVRQFNKELGSQDLLDSILDSNIKLNICGHIHTGEHGKHNVQLNNGNIANVYNVSILDEEYTVSYRPTVIEL